MEDGTRDPWGNTSRHLDTDLLTPVRARPLAGRDDVEVAVPLAILVHEELEKFGTSGNPELSEADIRVAVVALRALHV